MDDNAETESGNGEEMQPYICSEEQKPRSLEKQSSQITIASEGAFEDDGEEKTSEHFVSHPHGFQHKISYEHGRRNTEILGVTYNARSKRFVILDAKGISTWSKEAVEQNVCRQLSYPKYEYRLITDVIYAYKYNVYFALTKDFSLKVLNRDFEETCSVSSDMRSILFLIFNPVRDELITGGVGGTKIWMYKQVANKSWTDIKPMANYRLKLKQELENVGGSWVKRVDLELTLQHLYCCSDTDLYGYDMEGRQIFHFERAHSMSITGCAYSVSARLLITTSVDTEVKVWSLAGGLVHTFRGHSRAVTNLVIHPETSSLVLTSSLDGSVRMWSLDTMDCIYSLVVSTEGVLWMGLTDDRLLYLSTVHSLSLWSLNHVTEFYALARSHVIKMSLVHGEGKSTRIMAVAEDSSVRVFSRINQKNLSTVLPPPSVSPFQRIKGVAYNRVVSVVFLLIDTKEVWVYTTRTDPACRIAVWDILQIQEEAMMARQAQVAHNASVGVRASSTNMMRKDLGQRATEHGKGTESIAPCLCVCYLNSTAMVHTEEGFCCPLKHNYLLFGLEDGRILFMDPVIKGMKYFEFRASKDPVVEMKQDTVHNVLMTLFDVNDAKMVKVWALPTLELLHEIWCPPDVNGFIRIGACLITAHQSGLVLKHLLEPLQDSGQSAYRPKFSVSDDSSESNAAFGLGKPDHIGPVIAIDVCANLGIFCTCSPDGAIKIWDSEKTLMTELQLDDTLTAACFLNHRGDLLVGYSNHIFVINHSFVCPSIKVPEDDEDDTVEVESDVYEDPAVKYEGVVANPDPIDLKNYLVPYEMEFSKDFIEGKKPVIPPKEVEQEEEDAGSELSAAPTDIYLSPVSSPRRLSRIDLTLSPEPSNYELQRHLATMLEAAMELRSPGISYADQETDPEDAEMMQFQWPQFGISPGPTPSPSTPSSICTPSSCDVSEGGESTPAPSDEEVEEEGFKPIQTAAGTPADQIQAPKAVKKTAESANEDAPSSSVKSRLANIRVDPKALMREDAKRQGADKVVRPRKEADHSHVRGEETVTRGQPREVKKKVQRGERRKPKSTKRPIPSRSRRAGVFDGGTSRGRRGSDSYPGRLRKSFSKRPSIAQVLEACSESSDEESDDDEGQSRKSSSHTPLEIKPGKFGAGAEAGVTSSRGGVKKGGRKHLIEYPSGQKPGVGLSPTSELDKVQGGSGVILTTPGTEPATVPITTGVLQTEVMEPNEQSVVVTMTTAHSSPVVAMAAPPSSLGVAMAPHGDVATRTVMTSVAMTMPSSSLVVTMVTPQSSPVIAMAMPRSSSVVAMAMPPSSPVVAMTPPSSPVVAMTTYGDLTTVESSVAVTGIDDSGNHDDSANDLDGLRVAFEDTDDIPAGEGVKGQGDIPRSPSQAGYLSSGEAARPLSSLSTGTDSPSQYGSRGHDFKVFIDQWGDVTQEGQAQDQGQGHRMRSPFERLYSPTIYSDHGSEWTLPQMDDAEQARLAAILEDLEEEEREDYLQSLGKLILRRRQAASSTPADGSPSPWSPYAATREGKLTLEQLFEEALRHYNQTAPGSKPAEGTSRLHQNDGLHFEENWQDRMIERHNLLRMQKQLRAQSAAEKRQLLQLRQKQRRKGLTGHSNCDTSAAGEKSESTSPIIETLREAHREALRSACEMGRTMNSSSSLAWSVGQRSRPHTSHMVRSRPETSGSAMSRPQTSNMTVWEESPRSRRQVASASRPHTAVRSPSQQWAGSRPQTALKSRSQTALRSRPPTAATSRPYSAGARSRPQTAASTAYTDGRMSVAEKSDLGAERPFRAKINQITHKLPRPPPPSEPQIDIKLLDPRNPEGRASRLHAGKSIPSKCTRYILVTRDKVGDVVPTPLEEQLIPERFPEWSEYWLGPQRPKTFEVPHIEYSAIQLK